MGNPKFCGTRHDANAYGWSKHYLNANPAIQISLRDRAGLAPPLRLPKEPIQLMVRDLGYLVNQAQMIAWSMELRLGLKFTFGANL